MNKELLKYCRFFKGEAKCPFKDDNSVLWFAERAWVKLASSAAPLLDEYLSELKTRLPQMANHQGTNMSLKAFLLDRYVHFGGSDKGFPSWFAENYPVK